MRKKKATQSDYQARFLKRLKETQSFKLIDVCLQKALHHTSDPKS